MQADKELENEKQEQKLVVEQSTYRVSCGPCRRVGEFQESVKYVHLGIYINK